MRPLVAAMILPDRVRRGLLGAACATAFVMGATPVAAQGTAYEQLQTFSSVLGHIRTNYVDSVQFSSLVQAAIRGMLRSLDPHSYYVSRRDFELRAQWERGLLAGVGLDLEDADGVATVLAVSRGGPAAKAGVQPGDRIRTLDDSTIAGVGARSLEVRLLGDKGSKVRLTFERGPRLDPDTFAVTLKRATIDAHVVAPPRMLDAQTGYVRLTMFTPLAPKELTDAIKKAKGMGAKQLVLDLRGNPGGSMGAMIDIASAFLPAKREVFHTQGRKKIGIDSVVTRENGDFAQLPLIVLLDEGSASAAETLAGTLQDNDRALVVGRRSFGKALIQSALPLSWGDVIWLTTARIVTPSGRVIQRRYRGLEVEQYEALGGAGGAAEDTTATFRTSAGREVRGGGGIEPDVVRPGVDLPVWFSVAADSGYISAVADSVAQTLAADPAARDAWFGAAERWDRELVQPFLTRVQARLKVRADPEAPVRQRLGRILAARAAEVRWGAEGAEEFFVRNDPDVRLALATFPRLAELLRTR